MFSLAELQNSRASLKKRSAEPQPDPECVDGNVDQDAPRPSVPPSASDNFKTNIPLPSISLQTLASAQSNLFKISKLRSPTSATARPGVQENDVQDDDALPAFAKRKELFEKRQTHVATSVN